MDELLAELDELGKLGRVDRAILRAVAPNMAVQT